AQVGALYASFMDVATVERLGVAPLREELDLIDSVRDRAALTSVLGRLQRTGGAGGVAFWVDNDAKDPERYVVYLMQSGLGLPDEAYYREEQYAPIREQYVPHVARMLGLLGVAADAADQQAAWVLDLETRLA